MILYSMTHDDNSSIWITKNKYGQIQLHVREWHVGEGIKDARFTMQKEQLNELISMLDKV